MKKKNLEKVLYVSWEESERGWGTRPDGCSLHLTINDWDSYFKSYVKTLPRFVPDEYSRPAGRPIEVEVTHALYKRIEESKYGIRIRESELRKLQKGKLFYTKERSGWMPLEK
jgi:hypothetical protein